MTYSWGRHPVSRQRQGSRWTTVARPLSRTRRTMHRSVSTPARARAPISWGSALSRPDRYTKQAVGIHDHHAGIRCVGRVFRNPVKLAFFHSYCQLCRMPEYFTCKLAGGCAPPVFAPAFMSIAEQFFGHHSRELTHLRVGGHVVVHAISGLGLCQLLCAFSDNGGTRRPVRLCRLAQVALFFCCRVHVSHVLFFHSSVSLNVAPLRR